jgi:hypothetical protein
MQAAHQNVQMMTNKSIKPFSTITFGRLTRDPDTKLGENV